MYTKNQISLQRKILYAMLLLIVFLSAFNGENFDSVRALGTHTITYFKDNKPGAISITFDDGYASQTAAGVSELNARGLKGTFFIVTGTDWISGHVPWAVWQSVVAQGHEVASHTVTHRDLTTLSEGEMRSELTGSQAAITQNVPGQACASLSYPFTASNSTVQAAVADYYVAARGGWLGNDYLNYYQSGSDQDGTWVAINFLNIGSRSQDGVPTDDQYFNILLDRAVSRHAWFPLMFHSIPDAAAFGNVLDYVQAKHDYWIDTFCNVARYMKERLNSTVQVITDNASEIRLNIVMSASLPTTTYNFPLTLRSTVPASWPQVRVQQGSAIQTFVPVLEGSEKVVYYNAIPNGGDVVLTNPFIPTITNISPASTFAGSAGFTLTVSGTNFMHDSIVRWNGVDRITTYVSNTQLTASIPASDIASVGTANVTVFNPILGGGTSSQLPFTIFTKPVTVTVNANQSKIYGNADPIFSYTSSDPAATFTGTLGRASGENVGAYAINLGTLAVVGSNYAITSFVPANFSITAKPITVTVNPNQSKIYGNADPIFSYASSDPAVTFTGMLSRASGENVGTYAINQGTLVVVGGNYIITAFVPANFSVTIKPITVTVNLGQSKVYGGVDPIFSYTSSDPAATFTGALSRTSGENVGAYTINQGTLNVVGSNHTITSFVPTNFVINKKIASVTPNAASKIFGSVDPILIGTLVGFLPADNVTATYSRIAGENVASSPYTISAILSPAGVLGNYNITANTANFTIIPTNSTVTLGNLNYVYDSTQKSATATTTPPGLPVDITYNGSPIAPTDAGSYTVVAVVNDPNYTGAANGTLVIAPAIVNPSITANNKIYDGTTAATITTRNLSGVFLGDIVSLSGGTAAFANKNVGNNKTVTAVGLTLAGADAGNYQLSSTSATAAANITQRMLTITATGVNKGYDGTTAATVTLSDDRIGGDNLTANYTTAAFLDPNVGSSKTVNVSGLSISSGSDAGNYTLGNITATTTAAISIAAQTITVTTSAPAAASEGSNFNVAATTSSGLLVAITSSGVCSGGGTTTATITMNSGSGVCSVFYNQAGNTNYSAASPVQNDVTATQKPSITSADNIIFSLGLPGTFTVTTTGNPATPMVITVGGALPAGVTFMDNSDGTAVLAGTPTTAGIYPLTFTANNGVLPNAAQNFTLTIKNGPIIGAKGINWASETGNGNIRENEIILDTFGITQINVEFSQDVNDPAGDIDPKDVTNPANYLLVLGSSDGVFQTLSCSAGLVSPDVAISVDSVTYDNNNGAGPFIATLGINGGNPLNAVGFYRLYVCGTTSIADAVNINLKLAGDGARPGTDFLRNFRISTRVSSTGNGGSNNSTNPTKALTTGNLLIPVTGFTPNQVTSLPNQPADKAYKSLGGIRIEIPTLGINFPIVGVMLDKNSWDLTWLKDSVGYLEGSAYPTLPGNAVLTAHVRDANNNLGPFSDIKGLQTGQKIYIHTDGQVYVYQVQENEKILASNISAAFKHEDYSWITLVTCEDYNAKTGLYAYRRMVRAVLVSIIPEK